MRIRIAIGVALVLAVSAIATITAGSLSVIPRGVPHAIERRGKNPLILLSTLSGAPCAAVHPTDRD